MSTLTRLFSIATFGFAAVFAASSASAADEAKVVKLSGNATMTIPGQEPVALEMGSTIPKGATITTDASGEVYVETIPGAIASIKPNSRVVVENIEVDRSGDTVTSQTSALDLQEGDIVSTIDPSKSDINHYSIRTPKGVAAARGTGYSVSVHEGGITVAATADSVSFSAGNTHFTVSAGMVTITGPGGALSTVPLASVAHSDPRIAAIINAAVVTVSVVVANDLGHISASASTNLISQIVAVASAANPAGAAGYTALAITAASSPRASTGTSSATAVAAITAAAVTAAPSEAANIATAGARVDSSQAAVVAAAAATAAPSDAAAIAAGAAKGAPASAGAITDAVEQVAGSSSAAIVQAVATATNQTTQQVQQAANQSANTNTGNQAAQTANNANQTVVQPVVPTVISSPSS